MAKTSRGHPDDNRSIVSSRAERYKQWERKKSAPSPPPLARTRQAKVKQIALTTINDVTSPLSASSVASIRSGDKLINPPMEYANMTAPINERPLKSDHNKDNDNDVDGRKYDDVDYDDEEYNVDDGNDGYDDDEEFNVDDGNDKNDDDNDDEEYIDVDDGDGDDYDKNDDDNLPPLPPEINVDGMSNYEIRRLRKIHRNEARLKSLGLGNDGEGKRRSSKVPKTSMRVKPGDGLYYPDDDAYEADVFNEDYDDKYRSSIPSEAAADRNRNRIMGGPQLPDNATRADYRHYKAERKAYTDSARRKLMQNLSSIDMNSTPQKEHNSEYTGDQSPHIRVMSVVEHRRLMQGHTFPDKETLMIRVAEEANYRNIKVKVLKSCKMQYEVGGDMFYVKASHRLKEGWKVTACVCRDSDDSLVIPERAMFISEKSLRHPFTGKWIGHILRSHLETCPGMSYVHMRSLCENYVNPNALTDNILQEARDTAKLDLFGDADDNVKYSEAIRDAIVALGHTCELLFANRRDVISKLQTTVLREELKRREASNQPALEKGKETEEFLQNWSIEHEVELTRQLGMEDGPPLKFLTGILIATSTSKKQLPFLEEVIQADGAHMSFGKYTLFSAYANTANGTMASLGFAILFGNEDTTNWIKFWTFIKSVHPIVNQPTKTVITDQDKGSLASIRQILPDAGLFHCAFHRRQNIKKKFGGGEGNTALTCLWMYNLLVKCSSVAAIRFLKQKYEDKMKPAHVAYLSALNDDQQYPAARCDKAHDVCMYGKTASSGVESMNRANDNVRARTAVDMVNAALILLKKEGIRYERAQSDAHKKSKWSDSHLTPKGMTIMEEIFAKCDPSIYRVQMTDFPDYNQFVVSKKSAAMRQYIVKIPKVGMDHGSRFGTCSCGFPMKEGIPCDHMVAITKAGRIPNLSRVELMPFWHTRAQWQLQFPKDEVYKADITWANIKKTADANEHIRYCPTWSAPNKKGRPKTNVRKLGISDHIKQAGAKRRKKKVNVPLTVIGEEHADDACIQMIEESELKKEDNKDGVAGSV